MIRNIQDDLRDILPIDCTVQDEHIRFPSSSQSQNSDSSRSTTIHVDSFIYDDEKLDELCELGKISRNYCQLCGSHQVSPLTFISHSASLIQVKFIFEYILSDLRGKTVIDIGSRLGALLYGAYFYSSAERIVGVEISADWCRIQQQIIEKYKLSDRIEVLNSDVSLQSSLLSTGDVVIMNNVFEYFMPDEEQKKMWMFLSQTVRKSGALIITLPSIEESMKQLQLQFPQNWLCQIDLDSKREIISRELFPDEIDAIEDNQLHNVYLYEVLG
ncbi:uncharacterized protein LOC141912844 isoform X2 [Tubulanus polymorphus]